MTPTLSDVHRYLDHDDVDYTGAATQLGPEALPILEQLIGGNDPRLASKAAYLANIIETSPAGHDSPAYGTTPPPADGYTTDVERYLDHDDVDYTGAATQLGPEALPILEQLIGGDDPMLASKAAYLASIIETAATPTAAAQITTGSTLSDVHRYLDQDEVDYTSAASHLGPQAMPILEQLVRGDDPMLASKAAYLASLIPDEGRLAVLNAAATSPHAAVRVSAASALRNLDEHDADPLAEQLMSDIDVGVRKLTVRAAASFDSARMAQRLRNVATNDSDETLRSLAASALQDSHEVPNT